MPPKRPKPKPVKHKQSAKAPKQKPAQRAPKPRGTAPKLRPLAAQDLDAVVAIDASLSGRTRRAYFERRLAAALRAPQLHAQFAVDDGGALAGYVLGRALEGEFGSAAPAMRLEVIGVKRELQGRGAGIALGHALEEAARKRGLGEMRTAALWRDAGMLRFLDRSGYRLASDHIIECALGAAALGSGREEPVAVPERPADQNDYSGPGGGDYQALARDLADVRSLAAADLEHIVRIDRRLTGRDRTAYMRHKLADALEQSAIRVSLMARRDGAPAGYLMASADYGDFGRAEPAAVIDTIGVDPGFARSGVGRALFSQLFVNLRALGIERVETTVARGEFALLAFFYACGFEPSERLAFVRRID